MKLQVLETRQADGFAAAFETAVRQRAQAVMLLPAPLMTTNAVHIADLTLKNRLPAMSPSDQTTKAGGLASYAPSVSAIFQRAAYYVDRILKDEKPADLPVEQPAKFHLIINFKTAKALGLTIAPTLLAIADEVIE